MTDRRLIEEELPLRVVNAESAREKSLRHGHISTMHLWWARRPLAMSRAVVFGTLLPDPGDDAKRKEILDLLAEAAPFEASVQEAKINPLKKLLADAYPDGPPKVLDCFAGGGAIPLEALRLGCDVTAVDLNPVAHLIEKCVLEYPQRFGELDELGNNTLADDFVKWAGWVRDRVAPDLAEVFPADEQGRRPAVYFWARTMTCPGCRREIPLLSSFWLANSSRRTVWVEPVTRGDTIDLDLRDGAPPESFDASAGTVKASSVGCPACGYSAAAKDVREYGKRVGFGSRLYAAMDVEGRDRTYRPPRHDEISAAKSLSLEDILAAELTDDLTVVPDEECDENGFRRVQSIIFGIDTWSKHFLPRQLYVMKQLVQTMESIEPEMTLAGVAEDRAVALRIYLALLIDKMADNNSSFTTWRTTAEASRSTFARQAIAMCWDHIEVFPLGPGGIWDAHVEWMRLAIAHCSTASRQPASVQRGNAQDLDYPDSFFDAVIIDPPYYDSIQYSYLSDYFFVWLKRTAAGIAPALVSTSATPKTQEVIQNQARKSSPAYISDEEFDLRLRRALSEVRRVLKDDGVASIVFAHTDAEAWERLLRALRTVDLVVTTSWPMRSERAGRTNAALQHAVLGSSVVLVCRPSEGTDEGFYDDVVRALEARIAERLDAFEEMGLAGADYFVSAIGPAFDVFAQYRRIVKLSGEEVDVSDLMVLARQVVARHAMRRLLGSDSLTALDPESIFYLTWRWAYLTAPIPADEAYKLEKAFDVDLSLLTRPGGIGLQSGSKFSMLGPHERKKIKLSASPSLIDVLHIACQLWDEGRRKELEELLGATGMGVEPSFWAAGRALAETLPDGAKERTMLLGLTGNRDALSEAAAKSTTSIEELQLFDTQP